MVRGRKQSGVALVYAVLSIVALMGIVSLSVDIGHVQLVKTQLRCAADSAARAAASYVGTVPTARSLAVQYAAANKADGAAITIDANQDVDFGHWDKTNHTFTVLTGNAQAVANAVRVT